MKAAVKTFACVLACGLAGCNKSPQQNDGAAANPALAQSKAVAAEQVQLQGAVAGATAGRIGDYSEAPAADATAPTSPPGSAGSFDQFRGIDQSGVAPAMVIRTGQAFIEVDKV